MGHCNTSQLFPKRSEIAPGYSSHCTFSNVCIWKLNRDCQTPGEFYSWGGGFFLPVLQLTMASATAVAWHGDHDPAPVSRLCYGDFVISFWTNACALLVSAEQLMSVSGSLMQTCNPSCPMSSKTSATTGLHSPSRVQRVLSHPGIQWACRWRHQVRICTCCHVAWPHNLGSSSVHIYLSPLWILVEVICLTAFITGTPLVLVYLEAVRGATALDLPVQFGWSSPEMLLRPASATRDHSQGLLLARACTSAQWALSLASGLTEVIRKITIELGTVWGEGEEKISHR